MFNELLFINFNSAPEKQTSFTTFHRIGAFAQQKPFKDLKNGLDDVPFLNLLQPTKTDIVTNTQIKPQPIKSSTSSQSISESTGSISKSSSSQASAPDDFVMIELVSYLILKGEKLPSMWKNLSQMGKN